MKHHVIGTSAKLTDLAAGDCFVFSHRDGKKYIGMAIEGAQPGTGLEAAIIYPGHPSSDGTPGIYAHSVLRHKTLFKLSDAEIVPSTDLKNINCGYDDFNPPAGLLFLVEGELVLLCSNNNEHDKRYINMRTGKYAENFSTESHVYFTNWKIVVPNENGEKTEIVTYSMKSREPEEA